MSIRPPGLAFGFYNLVALWNWWNSRVWTLRVLKDADVFGWHGVPVTKSTISVNHFFSISLRKRLQNLSRVFHFYDSAWDVDSYGENAEQLSTHCRSLIAPSTKLRSLLISLNSASGPCPFSTRG